MSCSPTKLEEPFWEREGKEDSVSDKWREGDKKSERREARRGEEVGGGQSEGMKTQRGRSRGGGQRRGRRGRKRQRRQAVLCWLTNTGHQFCGEFDGVP